MDIPNEQDRHLAVISLQQSFYLGHPSVYGNFEQYSYSETSS